MAKNNKKRQHPSAMATATLTKDATPDNSSKNKTSNNNKKKTRSNASFGDNQDWLTTLVQQSASGNDAHVPSKEDRKLKRQAKKARREQQQQKQKIIIMRNTNSRPVDDRQQQQQQRQQQSAQTSLLSSSTVEKISKRRLRMIASSIDRVRQKLYGNGDNARMRLYDSKVAAAAAKTVVSQKKKKRQWNEISIQPRTSDYSGIGLARHSLYIEFMDPSCLARLEEEFQEHIPGFFGKQRTKAMKRQSDGNMLWRQLAEKKDQLSKKLQGMNPDERAQAMIDAGMI
jgi:hypothetical protein